MISKSCCIFGTCVMLTAACCGCRSWSPGGFPMQSMSRVPPPGTGTYQLPNGYYNNNQTSAVAPTGQVMTASTAGGLRPAGSGSLPTTNLTDTAYPQGSVQTAQFTQVPSNAASFQSMPASNPNTQVTQADGFQPQTTGAPMQGPPGAFETTDLQWQP